eukprot:Rhum_TRINITY_DN15123_c8_g1::Rhum_TRINITY_DN15123_c8_g1_i2::g.139395::m.139395
MFSSRQAMWSGVSLPGGQSTPASRYSSQRRRSPASAAEQNASASTPRPSSRSVATARTAGVNDTATTLPSTSPTTSSSSMARPHTSKRTFSRSTSSGSAVRRARLRAARLRHSSPTSTSTSPPSHDAVICMVASRGRTTAFLCLSVCLVLCAGGPQNGGTENKGATGRTRCTSCVHMRGLGARVLVSLLSAAATVHSHKEDKCNFGYGTFCWVAACHGNGCLFTRESSTACRGATVTGCPVAPLHRARKAQQRPPHAPRSPRTAKEFVPPCSAGDTPQRRTARAPARLRRVRNTPRSAKVCHRHGPQRCTPQRCAPTGLAPPSRALRSPPSATACRRCCPRQRTLQCRAPTAARSTQHIPRSLRRAAAFVLPGSERCTPQRCSPTGPEPPPRFS